MMCSNEEIEGLWLYGTVDLLSFCLSPADLVKSTDPTL